MDILKGLGTAADVLRKADKIPEYQQILEAQKALLDFQRKVAELEEEIKTLKDIKEFKTNAEFRNNCYVVKTSGKEDYFCSKCVDADNTIIRLHVRHSDGHANCPNCKNAVWIRGEPNYSYDDDNNFLSNPTK